ncbi:hypothetical protein [Sessilibacter sp. MAH4]
MSLTGATSLDLSNKQPHKQARQDFTQQYERTIERNREHKHNWDWDF